MQCLHDWKVTFAFEGPADEPATVLADCVRKKLAHAFDAPEISRIFTREVLKWCSTWRRTRRSTGC
jgi:TetR/AcrR family transcriptional regulator